MIGINAQKNSRVRLAVGAVRWIKYIEGRAMAEDMTDKDVLRRLTALFAVFCGVCLLAGASRMSPCAWELRPFGDVLRIREALSMFVYAPALAVLFWLIGRASGRGKAHVAVDALMVLAIYMMACGMGMHDPREQNGGGLPPRGGAVAGGEGLAGLPRR
jgi:hypothetical protein